MGLNTTEIKKNIFFVFFGSFVCVIGYLFILSGILKGKVSLDAQKESAPVEQKTILPKPEIELPETESLADAIAKLKEQEATLWIQEDDGSQCVVTLGKKDGVRKGMVFDIYEGPAVLGQVKVTRADDGYSLVRLLSFARDGAKAGYYTVRVSSDTQ